MISIEAVTVDTQAALILLSFPMEVEIAIATVGSIGSMGATLTSGASIEVGIPLWDSSNSQALNNWVGILTFFVPVCWPQGIFR